MFLSYFGDRACLPAIAFTRKVPPSLRIPTSPMAMPSGGCIYQDAFFGPGTVFFSSYFALFLNCKYRISSLRFPPRRPCISTDPPQHALLYFHYYLSDHRYHSTFRSHWTDEQPTRLYQSMEDQRHQQEEVGKAMPQSTRL
jgi:hypothetical protein